ncbi:monosaccharide-sensing protein 2-like [Trifolium medium]|uniref:Monosaccharide-sensing protein 2-like n=1 Tax=Trifolium medium TaxID=97028 RepID=A0A392P869_9FABA|nr:monosaccharide-sensing protein 2-like [Trifolium medium]
MTLANSYQIISSILYARFISAYLRYTVTNNQKEDPAAAVSQSPHVTFASTSGYDIPILGGEAFQVAGIVSRSVLGTNDAFEYARSRCKMFKIQSSARSRTQSVRYSLE